jgi:hypothetical protein
VARSSDPRLVRGCRSAAVPAGASGSAAGRAGGWCGGGWGSAFSRTRPLQQTAGHHGYLSSTALQAGCCRAVAFA